ncbi:RHE_PE00001 family protein [Rhizobium sp. HT1-10]|uniref:RHE_PE00001 family protein n=1 Tax=Rhizobium sp. HT1-10 TaxID=3111638 RepID=UPI003C273DB6
MRYELNPTQLSALLPCVIHAEDRLARLDERVLRHAIGDGFRERGHFFDAVAALWVGGELVHVEDLVLHDAHMDARTPTHELTIAHAMLRARRRLWQAEPGWGLDPTGIAALRGSGETGGETVQARTTPSEDETEDAFSLELAAIDALLARSDRLLEETTSRAPETKVAADHDPLGLIHDDEWDETERLREWRAVIQDADRMPPVLGAAALYDAWERLEPLRRQHWLGGLLTASYLRMRGKVTSHLFCFNVGLKTIRFERRRAPDRFTRLTAFLEAMAEAADAGLKELDRLTLAKTQMERRLKDRRSNSSLPATIDLVLSRPIVSAGMVARHVGITPRGALNLVADLGIREMTGRGRYRGWGVL